MVTNFIEIFWLEKRLTAPFTDPGFVEVLIMQWEDRLHTLPFLALGRNSRASFRLWGGDEVVH